jgi:hypothetical protein
MLRQLLSYRAFKTARWNAHRNIKKLFPEQKHIIKFAFEVAGRAYYCFDDVFAQPYERGLMAIVVYEEAKAKISRDYLQKHVEAISNILQAKQIDIYKIHQLNEQMKDRLNLSCDVDLLYKLASVIYFDKNENPCLYEADYCAKKVAYWRQHKGVADFFLQKPVAELIPFLRSSDTDLEAYSALSRELNEVHLERLRALGSKS